LRSRKARSDLAISLSDMIPTRRPLSTTGTRPTSRSSIMRRAWTSRSLGLTVRGTLMASPAVPLTLTAVRTSLGRTHPMTFSPSMTTRTPVFCIRARASSTCISGSTLISESMVAEATCRDEAGIPRDFRAPRTRAICLVVITPPSLSLLVTRSLRRSFFSI